MRLFPKDLSGRQKTTLKDFNLLTKLTTFWPNGAWEKWGLVVSSTLHGGGKRRAAGISIEPLMIMGKEALSTPIFQRGVPDFHRSSSLYRKARKTPSSRGQTLKGAFDEQACSAFPER